MAGSDGKNNMQTVETAAATIRFTAGNAASDSDSDSSEDPNTPVIGQVLDSKSTNEINTRNETKSQSPAPPDTDLKSDETTTNTPMSSCCANHQNSEYRQTRFNPFNKDSEIQDVPEERFPQLSGGRDGSTSPQPGCSWMADKRSPITQEALIGITEDHFSEPEGDISSLSVEDLEFAIEKCKLEVLESGANSEERRHLVEKLVRLRFRLSEIKDSPDSKDTDEEEVKIVVGHHFERQAGTGTRHYCEQCNSLIWGVLQTWYGWYRCQGCGFCSHTKCLNLITRQCASVKIREDPTFILDICPERGLGAQNYKCMECHSAISYQSGFGEPRQCDYTGLYYCNMCHWNNTMVIPARVLHNWDFEARKVCRASRQFLKLMSRRPVIRIQDINPMLFNYVEELNEVKKLREEILIMKKYFLECKDALNSKHLLQLQNRQHFVESSDMYSLQDLSDVVTDTLLPQLAKIHTSFAQHIKTDCPLCRGKGYVCEICSNEEVLFPFDNHAIVCSQCSTVLHRHCYMRRQQQCPRCQRLSKRSTSSLEDIPALVTQSES